MRRQAQRSYEFGPFRLEPKQRRLLRDGLVVPLTPKVFDTLVALVRNRGSLVEKQSLMRELWPDTFVEDGNLTFNISVLRKALGESAQDAGFIETVPKRGYRFVAPVRELPEDRDLKSVAVLPFADLSSLSESAFFAVGMHEALISELAQIRTLRVISRTTSMRYADGKQALPEFAHALHLDFAVEGSVVLEGNKVRIGVRLVDAWQDRLIWAESYERPLLDILSLQRELARSIAQRIEIRLTPREEARLGSLQPVDPNALISYLRGRYYWHQFFTQTALQQAISLFREAIRSAPEYAQAWSGLSDCHSAMAVQSMMPPRDAAQEAKDAARKALELDPLLAEAHVSMAGFKLFFEWDWVAAERSIAAALDLSPSCSMAHGLFTHYAAARGWGGEAIASAQRALELDPMSAVMHTDLAWIYLLNGQYERAREQCLHSLNMEFNFPLTHVYLGQVFLHEERFQEGIEELRKALPSGEPGPAPIVAMLGYAYGVAGQTVSARQALRQIEGLSEMGYVSAYDRAVIYAGLSEKTEAFRWLGHAFEERSPRVIWLNVEPAFKILRNDQRFKPMFRRLKLT